MIEMLFENACEGRAVFSFPDVCQQLGFRAQLLDSSRTASGASIDTKTLMPGDLFVALKGTRTDGHLFIEDAFQKGASGALIDEKYFDKKHEYLLGRQDLFRNLLIVPNVQAAMIALAAWYRARFNIPVIGVTGSIGKTTTKEFLHYLLSRRSRGIANVGNLNNHLGVPLTLLRLGSEDAFCVAELGANHPGEIKYLAEIIRPTAGLITQIAAVHLEGFGSIDSVCETKLELFGVLAPHSIAVLPENDHKLFEKARRYELSFCRVGTTPYADYRLSNVKIEDGYVSFIMNEKYPFRFKSAASFLAMNASMALAMAEKCGVKLEDIPADWDDFKVPGGRFQEHRLAGGVRIINDAYNASPHAFKNALKSFHELSVTGRKIVVFADMMELGEQTNYYHRELGREIAKYPFDCVLGYGPLAEISLNTVYEVSTHAIIHKLKDAKETAKFLSEYLNEGDAVLLKGSHAMKVDDVLQSLREDPKWSDKNVAQ